MTLKFKGVEALKKSSKYKYRLFIYEFKQENLISKANLQLNYDLKTHLTREKIKFYLSS